jgi:hypothetical protein
VWAYHRPHSGVGGDEWVEECDEEQLKIALPTCMTLAAARASSSHRLERYLGVDPLKEDASAPRQSTVASRSSRGNSRQLPVRVWWIGYEVFAHQSKKKNA